MAIVRHVEWKSDETCQTNNKVGPNIDLTCYFAVDEFMKTNVARYEKPRLPDASSDTKFHGKMKLIIEVVNRAAGSIGQEQVAISGIPSLSIQAVFIL